MIQYLLGFLVFAVMTPVWGAPHKVSAKRGILEDWRVRAHISRDLFSEDPNEAIGQAKPLPEVDFNKLVPWTQVEIQEQFQHIRDHRFLEDPSKANFLRRSSWLYPDDGCHARAALAIQNLPQWVDKPAAKIFVFGNLEVQTKNSFDGFVTWWFHVAPIVTDGAEKYVLDPAIEPLRALTLQEWLNRMGNPNDMTMVVCDAKAYLPFSNCQSPSAHDDENAEVEQAGFLSMERWRLEELGRDPEKELGDSPPWLMN